MSEVLNQGENSANQWEGMAQAAAEDAARENNVSEVTDDDVAYQKKLIEMQETRDDSFDYLSEDEIVKHETNTGINAKGEEYKRMPWNTWDTYARRGKDANNEHYYQKLDWDKRMTEAAANTPRRIIVGAAGDDRQNETREQFQRDVMNNVFSDIAKEQAEDPNRKLNAVEMEHLQKMYPRNDGENTSDWAARIAAETGLRFGGFLHWTPAQETAPEDVAVGESAEVAEESVPEVATAEESAPEVAAEDENARQSWDSRLEEAKSKFEQMDGESADEYERRMKTVVVSNLSTEMHNHSDRSLTDVEYTEIADMYPRNDGESVNDWYGRIKEDSGIDMRRLASGHSAPEQPEFVKRAVEEPGTEVAVRENKSEVPQRRNDKIRFLCKSDELKAWREMRGITIEQIDSMGDDGLELMYAAYGSQLTDFVREELGMTNEQITALNGQTDKINELIRKYNEFLSQGKEDEPEPETKPVEALPDNEAEAEKIRKEMVYSFGGSDLRWILEDEGLKPGDIRNLDIEGLKGLQEKVRPAMMRGLGSARVIDLLERDGVKISDLRNASFDEIREMREKYRDELMRGFATLDNISFLEENGYAFSIRDLHYKSLEEMVKLYDLVQDSDEIDFEETPNGVEDQRAA